MRQLLMRAACRSLDDMARPATRSRVPVRKFRNIFKLTISNHSKDHAASGLRSSV
jgi:hypothetical protein